MISSNLTPIDIDTNRRRLNRYRFVAHEAMRLMAGWLPTTALFELKCELGRAIWENSLHVNALYLRLREIQSPAFQKPDDPALIVLMEELPHAPDEFAFALGYFEVVVPSLIRALQGHEGATFPNSDLPSVHAIRHLLLDLRAQVGRLRPILAKAVEAGKITGAARAWKRYVRGLLAAAGGLSGEERCGKAPALPAGRREFQAPKEARRDERFTNCSGPREPMPTEEDYRSHTAREFQAYSTEMLAAETVAFILHSVRGMPWEFEFDSARHLYDEVRHSLMGYEWMRRYGMDPFHSPQFLDVYRERSRFAPVMQYCLLTMGNEVHAFPYRHRRVEAHEKSGERLSEQFVRYDIADETIHVRFGKRWLPELLKHAGEKRSFEEYTADIIKVWEEWRRTGKFPAYVE